jgi:hypothetical protein
MDVLISGQSWLMSAKCLTWLMRMVKQFRANMGNICAIHFPAFHWLECGLGQRLSYHSCPCGEGDVSDREVHCAPCGFMTFSV